jgi:hypothetical protein
MKPCHRPCATALVATWCCLLAACAGGGGGGGGGPGAGDAGATPTTAATRAVPGYTVGVTHVDGVTPGRPCTFALMVAADPGQPAVRGVAAWLGADAYAQPAATVAAVPDPGTADAWRVVMTLPDPIPADATVWLRITAADGAIMEIGRGAFELAGLPGG